MSSVLSNLNTRFVRHGWMNKLGTIKVLGKVKNGGIQPTWRVQVGAHFFEVRFNPDRQPVINNHSQFESSGTIRRRLDLTTAFRRAGYEPVLAAA